MPDLRGEETRVCKHCAKVFISAGDWKKLTRGEGQPQATVMLDEGSPGMIGALSHKLKHDCCFGGVNVDGEGQQLKSIQDGLTGGGCMLQKCGGGDARGHPNKVIHVFPVGGKAG
eukprot:9357392-Prorocentrum_lima.AAC.1